MSGVNDEVAVDDAPDADFEAGFSNTDDQTTTPEVEVKEEPAPEVAAEPAAPVEPKYAQVTEEQLASLLSLQSEATRKFDHAFGQLGGLKQTLERLQKEAPAGQSVEVSDEDFAELKAEFPELAEMQIRGLNKVLGKLRGTGPAQVDQTLIEQIVQERYGSQLADAREDALDGLHNIVPNWNSQENAKALGEWVAQQPEEVQALAASEKVRDAAALLRKFRDRQTAKPAPTPTTPQVSTRQRQLEAAVNPRSARGASPEPAEIDDFEAGFQSGRN